MKPLVPRSPFPQFTRALRARLSYASYKATSNIPHVPLPDLETQSQNQSQAASFNRTIAAKRKAAGANNYYNNPTTQGSGTAGNHQRGGSGTMAPPPSGSSPRAYHSSIHGTPGYSGYNEVPSSSRNTAVPNLYSSILAPPPAKQARTIHNPSDPPLPAPVRPTTPKPRVPKSSSTHDGNHQPKGRHSNKTSKAPASPNRRKNKRASVDKSKQKRLSSDMDIDGDIDMKAAATLTSLFMHHRPSIAGSASSPRSSIDGSEVGSVYSLSHFAQSSARTTSTGNPPGPVSATSSSTTIVADTGPRPQTPPSGSQVQYTTPRAAPTDTEAADLMLYLATSPSPVRPANKDARDMAAYRALGGGSGPLRSKGRVLFPSTSATDPPSGREDVSAATAGTLYRQPALTTKGGESSFTSSISSISTDLGGGARSALSDSSRGTVIAPVDMSGSEPSQLLPPAPLPLPLLPTAPSSPAGRRELISSPKAGLSGIIGGGSNSTPLDFNFHEFINASPSPSRGPFQGGGANHKSNLGLRADIERKLFEEEQMRHGHIHSVAVPTIGGPGNRQEDYTLSAGIDLVQG